MFVLDSFGGQLMPALEPLVIEQFGSIDLQRLAASCWTWAILTVIVLDGTNFTVGIDSSQLVQWVRGNIEVGLQRPDYRPSDSRGGLPHHVVGPSDLILPEAELHGRTCHTDEEGALRMMPLFTLAGRRGSWSRDPAAEESLGQESVARKSPLVAENGRAEIPWSAAQESLGLPGDESPNEVMRGRKLVKAGEVQVMLDKTAGG